MEVLEPLAQVAGIGVPQDVFPHVLRAQDTQPHRPVKDVAIIGAGYSGVVAAAHLSQYGFNVRVFERSAKVGGVWTFDARTPPEPVVPSDWPEAPAPLYDVTEAPPGPCYAGLHNNVPTTLMKSSVVDWPAGTPEFVTHTEVEAYIGSVVDAAGISPLIELNTVVLHVWKTPSGRWQVRTRRLDRARGFPERVYTVDAVVVASGHYHVPRIPDISGLAEWKEHFPGSVTHSKQYRDPASSGFSGKTLLLVGAGVSSLDMAKEAAGVARKIYQSSRGGAFDLPTSMLPEAEHVVRVAGVERFEASASRVHLADGTVLEDVDQVVLATGYITSYPYLGRRLQKPELELGAARKAGDGEVVVTADGLITHNLHRDIFYIPDPTLAFVGVPYHVSTFSFFDVQAQVVARVFAGHARLPGRAEMAAEYEARWSSEKEADEGRIGKMFHSLYGREDVCTDELLAWVNPQVEAAGGRPIKSPGTAWRARYRELVEMGRARRQNWPIARGGGGDGGGGGGGSGSGSGK